MHREASLADDTDRALKTAHRAMWALGDYHKFAKATVWGLGPVLVKACGISPGHRVLDVATGSGNTAIRAAQAGARVVATDLTPENFEAGRREARDQGVELEWMEADAEALPFGDDEFDVVTSSLGAMFAPRHQAVADQLLRVCRPGGTIGMLNFTPEGTRGRLLRRLRALRSAPAARRAASRAVGERGARPEAVRRPDRLPDDDARGVRGAGGKPVRILRAVQGDVRARGCDLCEPRRSAGAGGRARPGLSRLRDARQSGPARGPAHYRYEYLLVIARKRRR